MPALAHADGWGALAVDMAKAECTPYYGEGASDTGKEATGLAIKFCSDAGGVKCQALMAFQQSGALALSGSGDVGWGKAPTKKTAEAQAIAGCQNDACKVYVSSCESYRRA